MLRFSQAAHEFFSLIEEFPSPAQYNSFEACPFPLITHLLGSAATISKPGGEYFLNYYLTKFSLQFQFVEHQEIDIEGISNNRDPLNQWNLWSQLLWGMQIWRDSYDSNFPFHKPHKLLFWPLQNEEHGAPDEAALVGALLVAAVVVAAIRNTKTQIINRIIAKEKKYYKSNWGLH